MTFEQRHQLGDFLRLHRERLRAADVGLPDSLALRRRTPGLRREEVAQICGISATWYTWIEQGRDISVSPQALARLASALRMSRAERAYLFELTNKLDPAQPATQADEPLPAVLQQTLAASTAPAYALDRLWSAAGWNDAAARLFQDWLGGAEANLLRYVFCNESAKRFIADWNDRAHRLAAEFRADISRRIDDPAVSALVADLEARSTAFATLWNTHDVLAREGGLRLFNHPEDGLLRYEQVTLTPAGHVDIKIVFLHPREAGATTT